MAQDRTGLSQNVGTEWDLQMSVNGQLVAEFGLLEGRERKIAAGLVETIPANSNGKAVRRTTYSGGFSFSYSYVRQDDTFDDVVDVLVAAYQAQAANPVFQGLETVMNNGVPSQWLYTGGTLVPDGLGNIKGADKTDGVTFVIHWSDRQKIRGGSLAPDLSFSGGL